VCDFGGHPGHVPLGKGSAADPWGGWGDRSQTYLQLFFPQFANMCCQFEFLFISRNY